MERLKKRADFLKAAKGTSVRMAGFVLQFRAADALRSPPRVGFTVTKRQGNAVARNRIRRRLREAVRLGAPSSLRAGDYVVIGRVPSLTMPFARLQGDIKEAFRRVQQG